MEILKLILERFPRPITFCFAYGSGVKKQANYESAAKMIDIIFCVSNSEHWHKENLLKNPKDYSILRLLGGKLVTQIQENFAAKCYFNTLVPVSFGGGHNCMIKYGVISKEHLISDLINWEYLYISGRLQKPVEVLVQNDELNLNESVSKNLSSAVRTALLLLPENFNNYDLFYTISNLSYNGDFRMIFGENKRKVQNIVLAQLDEFYDLYLPSLQRLTFCLSSSDGKAKFQQDKSPATIKMHLRNLPSELKGRIIKNSSKSSEIHDIQNIDLIAGEKNIQTLVAKSLSEIVMRSSILQSLKNIPTAGLKKSILYSFQKSLKTFT